MPESWLAEALQRPPGIMFDCLWIFFGLQIFASHQSELPVLVLCICITVVIIRMILGYHLGYHLGYGSSIPLMFEPLFVLVIFLRFGRTFAASFPKCISRNYDIFDYVEVAYDQVQPPSHFWFLGISTTMLFGWGTQIQCEPCSAALYKLCSILA